MRIALVSEHASPLAAIGGVDAGGQNVHVAALAAGLARRGHEVTVHTRRDDRSLPARVLTDDGYEVHHVPAGPRRAVPKDDVLPHMGTFAQVLYEQWSAQQPDVVHAHFWMSGLASVEAARGLPSPPPVLQTFHALGSVKRRHQGSADTSPAHRIGYERELGRAVDRVIVQCRDEMRELLRLGVSRGRMALVPSGVNTDRFRPDGPAAPRRAGRARILTVA